MPDVWGFVWPDFNGVCLVQSCMGSLLVITVERRRLGCAERPSEGGGPTPSGEGSLTAGGTNQVWSPVQTLGLGSVGKGLATGSERRNFHGLVETLFWGLKGGNTARRRHQCMRARTQTRTLLHSFLAFFSTRSFAHKTHQQLGGGFAAVATLPRQRHISLLSPNEDTLDIYAFT